MNWIKVMKVFGINSPTYYQKLSAKLLDGMIKMETDSAILNVADAFRKAYNIGTYHVDKRKPMMSKDQFVDTYFPGPDMAVLFVEYRLTRDELHEVYKHAYRKANTFRILLEESSK